MTVGLKAASYIAFILALAYLAAGVLALYNWAASTVGAPTFAEGFARPSLGDALVLLAVGALTLPAPLMVSRREAVKALAAVFVGSLLAASAMGIEVLAQAATIADALLNGEEPPAFEPYNAQIVLGIPMVFLLAWAAFNMASRERLEALLERVAPA